MTALLQIAGGGHSKNALSPAKIFRLFEVEASMLNVRLVSVRRSFVVFANTFFHRLPALLEGGIIGQRRTGWGAQPWLRFLGCAAAGCFIVAAGTTPKALAQSCTNYQCFQVSCLGGATTSISGTTYAPNGVDPIPNVLVYVPNGTVQPFVDGPADDTRPRW